MKKKIPRTYAEFEAVLIENLQSKVADRQEAKGNVAQILARCAVGKYQILPLYHFSKINLDPGKLEDIYAFMNSGKLQDTCFQKIHIALSRKHQKNGVSREEVVKRVAVEYYGGEGGLRAYLSAEGDKNQRGGGSINSYANKAEHYYKEAINRGYDFDGALAYALEKIESGGTSA